MEDSDFSHLDLKLDEELNLDLLGSMITNQSPGGTVATHLGTPMVQTVAAADFLSYVPVHGRGVGGFAGTCGCVHPMLACARACARALAWGAWL
jgi:hypothetical protein